MKTLNWYIARSCLVTLVMSIGLLTFAVIGSRLIEVFRYLALGGGFFTAGKIIICFIPYAMALAIPLGFLVTIMLTFGRLSADNEITAMRACGVSILQIISPVIMLAFLLSFLCLSFQLHWSPVYADKARTAARDVLSDDPLALLEPGMQSTIQNMMMYVEERTSDNIIRNVEILRTDVDSGQRYFSQFIKADEGTVEPDMVAKKLIILLNDAQITSFEGGKRQEVTLKELKIPIDYSSKTNNNFLTKRPKYLSYGDIFGRMGLLNHQIANAPNAKAIKMLERERCELSVEINNRFALGLAPIAFLMLGLPLAIRTSRRETSVGLILAFGLSIAYLVSVVVISQLSSYPQIYPEYLLWIPVAIYQIIGAFLLGRLIRY